MVEFLNDIIEKYSMNIPQMHVVRSLCDHYFNVSFAYYRFCFILYTFLFVLPMTYFFVMDDKLISMLYIASVGTSLYLISELIQLRIEGYKYFADLWNVIDVIGIVGFYLLLFRRLNEMKVTDFEIFLRIVIIW